MQKDKAPRLIAVDCDGTFFNGDGYPSDVTLKTAKHLANAGHCIVAATGRSRRTACERLAMVPGMRHLICSNGAYGWNLQTEAADWETEITLQQVETIVSRLRDAFPDAAFGWEAREGIGFEDTFVTLAGGIHKLERGGHVDNPWATSLYKIKVRRPSVTHLALQREVSDVLGESLCEISTSGAPFVEITALGSHKGSGVKRCATQLGFTAEDVIVFGDNHNDLPMFRWAGHAVAMGNALEEVRAAADEVTLPNTEHGVAVYLEKLLDAGTL